MENNVITSRTLFKRSNGQAQEDINTQLASGETPAPLESSGGAAPDPATKFGGEAVKASVGPTPDWDHCDDTSKAPYPGRRV